MIRREGGAGGDRIMASSSPHGDAPRGRHALSVVEDFGSCSSACGYCSSRADSFTSHGMQAHVLTVDDYQALIDHGWRRSGSWVYKPALDTTCCPPYTIRLDAARFAPNKAQRRVERRMNLYLDRRMTEDGTILDGEDEGRDEDRGRRAAAADESESHRAVKPAGMAPDVAATIGEAVARALAACAGKGAMPEGIGDAASPPEANVRLVTAKSARQTGATHYCAVAMALASSSQHSRSTRSETAAAKRKELPGKKKHKVSDDRVHLQKMASAIGALLAEELLRDTALVAAGVTVVGRGEGGFLNFAASASPSSSSPGPTASLAAVSERGDAPPRRMGPRRELTITTTPSEFIEEEYQLWKRYQAAVHGDDEDKLGRVSYRRFLVDTPLQRVEGGEEALVHVDENGSERGWIPWKGEGSGGGGKGNGRNGGVSADGSRCIEGSGGTGGGGWTKLVKAPPSGFGSFHQQYRIDGRLVAVGVVDILPLCLSSKYFFWEPSLKALALGKFSSLREVDWVREASTHCPTLRYYYMGYYIHTCAKMRYKAEYAPSELKCPVSGCWVDFDSTAKRVLDIGVFSPLAEDVNNSGGAAGGSSGTGGGGSESFASEDKVRVNSVPNSVSADSAPLSFPDDTILGLVAGNQLIKCAPMSHVASQLPPPVAAALRAKIRRWQLQVGPAGGRIVYIVNLDQLAMSCEVDDECEGDSSAEDVERDGEDEDGDSDMEACTRAREKLDTR